MLYTHFVARLLRQLDFKIRGCAALPHTATVCADFNANLALTCSGRPRPCARVAEFLLVPAGGLLAGGQGLGGYWQGKGWCRR